jgi:hypothetical protein
MPLAQEHTEGSTEAGTSTQSIPVTRRGRPELIGWRLGDETR